MKLKKFNGFDEHGYMPFGIYEMDFDEFCEVFCKNTTSRRKEIMFEYKPYYNELKSSKYFLNHWIDGSYTTLKENPKDIDILTEFDGVKVDKNREKNVIHELIDNAPLKTHNLCHSLAIFRYPESDEEKYEEYLYNKVRFFMLFGSDSNQVPKGFVKLKN